MRAQDILDWLATPTGLAASSALVVTASALAVSSSSKRAADEAPIANVPGETAVVHDAVHTAQMSAALLQRVVGVNERVSRLLRPVSEMLSSPFTRQSAPAQLEEVLEVITQDSPEQERFAREVVSYGNILTTSQLIKALAGLFLFSMIPLTSNSVMRNSQTTIQLLQNPAMGIALQTVMPQYQNASLLSGGISPGSLLDIQYGSKHGPFLMQPPPPDLLEEPNLSMDWKKFAKETVSRRPAPAKPLHISNKPPIGRPAPAKPLYISNIPPPPIGRPAAEKALYFSNKPQAELQRPDNRDHALSAVPSCWHGLCLEEDGFHPLAAEQQGTLNTESSRHIDPIYANWFRLFLQSKNNNNNKKVLIANQIKKEANSSPAFIDDMFDVLLPELITKHFAMCVNHATEEKEVFLAQFIFYADALLAYAEIYKPRYRDHCIQLANDMISVIEYFIHHNHMPHAQYIAQKLEMPTEAAELVQQYNGLSIPATWYGLTYENRFRVTAEASRISKQTWQKFTKRDKDVQFVFYQIYLKYLSSYESAVIVMAQYMETLTRMPDGQRLLRSVFEDYLPMRLIDVFAATDSMPLYNTAEQRRGKLIEYFQMIDAFVLYASRRRMDMHGMFMQYLYETKGVMEVWIDPDADWPIIEPATEPISDFPSIEPATEPMADFPSIEPATEQMADWPSAENATEPVADSPSAENATEPMADWPSTENATEPVADWPRAENATEPMANWKPQPNTFSLRSFK